MDVKRVYLVVDYCEDIDSERRHDHLQKASVNEIAEAILRNGYDCEIFGGIKELVKAYDNRDKFSPGDLFMNLSTGLTHNGRKLQAPVLLEMLNVRYTGSDPFAHALANNKHYSKLAVSDYVDECATPRGILASKERGLGSLNDFDFFPAVVKPNSEGSSIGIDKNEPFKNQEEVHEQCESVVERFGEAVVEEYIEGADATCLVLGNCGNFKLIHPLVYEINGTFQQKSFVRSFHAKMVNPVVTRVVPLNSSKEHADLASRLRSCTKKIFSAIGCRDIARVDYRITPQGEPVFLEINALPMIEPDNPNWMSLKKVGFSFDEFIQMYIAAAASR